VLCESQKYQSSTVPFSSSHGTSPSPNYNHLKNPSDLTALKVISAGENWRSTSYQNLSHIPRLVSQRKLTSQGYKHTPLCSRKFQYLQGKGHTCNMAHPEELGGDLQALRCPLGCSSGMCTRRCLFPVAVVSSAQSSRRFVLISMGKNTQCIAGRYNLVLPNHWEQHFLHESTKILKQ
jgi:hypothetical protein